MKQVRGEPQVKLEVEDRKFFDRLLTQTDRPYDFAASHRRLFVKTAKNVEPGDEDWPIKYEDMDSYTMPKSALLRNIREARKAAEKTVAMLEQFHDQVKQL